MSEKILILHEEITSSQAGTGSAVGSARTHFAISINLHVPLKRKLLWRWARSVRVEFRSSLLLDIMAKLMKMRGRGRNRSWGCRCCLWYSRVSDLRVWVAGFHFLWDCPKRRTGGTDFVWGCYWNHSTSTIWVFKSSFLISFWFARIIWWPLIFSVS